MDETELHAALVHRAVFVADFSAGNRIRAMRKMVERIFVDDDLGHDELQTIVADLIARDGMSSFGIGNRIAIPHLPLDDSPEPRIRVGWFLAPEGVDFGVDHADLLICSVAPSETLTLLTARMLKILSSGEFAATFRSAQDELMLRDAVSNSLAPPNQSSDKATGSPSVNESSGVVVSASKQHAQGRVVVLYFLGIHARTSNQIVRVTLQFDCDIQFRYGGRTADGKNILDLMLLSAVSGAELDVETRGADASEALEAIMDLFAAGDIDR